MMNPFRVQGRSKTKGEAFRFVESVRVQRETRVKWKQAVLALFWILILIKCLLAHWAVAYWNMPFNSVWVWAPTVAAAILCTVVFLAGGDDTTE